MRDLLPLMILVLSALGLPQVAVAADGLPTDDPTLRAFQERTSTYMGRCRGDLSHVDESRCLADQMAGLRIRVNAEFKKRMADAEASAADGDRGGLTGAERTKRLQTGLKRAQATWDSYVKAECGAAFDAVELSGGNGGDLDQGACMIRHLVARYNELRR